jgi:hypothetical protein
VLGYTQYALPGTPVPWVQFSLVFEGAWQTSQLVGSEERWQYIILASDKRLLFKQPQGVASQATSESGCGLRRGPDAPGGGGSAR